MAKNTRRSAALKAVRTMKVRREFVEKFSEDTLHALANIAKNVEPLSSWQKRSLAAYKANLTRGTYSEFVSVGNSGSITRDRLGLTRMA